MGPYGYGAPYYNPCCPPPCGGGYGYGYGGGAWIWIIVVIFILFAICRGGFFRC